MKFKIDGMSNYLVPIHYYTKTTYKYFFIKSEELMVLCRDGNGNLYHIEVKNILKYDL